MWSHDTEESENLGAAESKGKIHVGYTSTEGFGIASICGRICL